ncbi:MAG TPA: hypothetical protein VGS80_25210 [Ktedonobacterales bacterium]|jgi:hypothetical protein|nr:hypothetical protein [Ktedonobacterales bacterium]
MPLCTVCTSPHRREIDAALLEHRVGYRRAAARFEHAHQHTLAQELRGAIKCKVEALVARNRTRMNYQEQCERLIAE